MVWYCQVVELKFCLLYGKYIVRDDSFENFTWKFRNEMSTGWILVLKQKLVWEEVGQENLDALTQDLNFFFLNYYWRWNLDISLESFNWPEVSRSQLTTGCIQAGRQYFDAIFYKDTIKKLKVEKKNLLRKPYCCTIILGCASQ